MDYIQGKIRKVFFIMRKIIDARGVDCPKPVTLTKEAFDDTGMSAFEIKLDSQVAFENVKRYIEKCGGKIDEMLKDGNDITLTVSRDKATTQDEKVTVNSTNEVNGISYIIASSVMGNGDEKLGKKLMNAFLSTISDYAIMPKSLFFMNHGVHLCLDDSEALDAIRALMEKGAEVIVCGTCTDYLGVTERVAIGILGNMYDLIEIYNGDNKVISV